MSAESGRRISDREPAFVAAIVFAALSVVLVHPVRAQSPTPSQQFADSALERWPAIQPSDPAHDEPIQPGLPILLAALDEEWLGTADAKYFQYVQASVDAVIGPDAAMKSVADKSSNLDNIALGRELLHLYRVTLQPKYFKAAQSLHARLAAGGFRLASIDSGPMGVDDLYSSGPFLAEYASIFHEKDDFKEIVTQFSVYDRRARDATTEFMRQRGAGEGKQSGAPELRSSALFLMALVDTLPWFPAADPGRAALLAMLRRAAAMVLSEQRRRGQSSDLQHGEGADRPSTLCILAHALAKGVRLGYLPQSNSALAAREWDLAAASLNWSTSGDDRATAGEFLLATRELDVAPLARSGRGYKVMLDAWFNSQKRKNALGEPGYFHYKWDDNSDSGFSMLGHLFNDYGIETDTLYTAPTAENLSSAKFYIVVSPDIPSKNPNPNYVTKRDAAQVAQWVKRGGILLMMENDPGNADIEHLDVLADIFGIHFNNVLSHHVIGDSFSMGRIEAPADGELLKQPLVLYMKDTCTITLTGAARLLLVDKGDVMMATAKYGKGTVFAVVDPWLYNEYTDGRKLPPEYGNFKGAQALLDWLVSRLPQAESENRR